MKTVLLLGAGASRAEALESVQNETELPPLDCTFFRQAKDLSIEPLGLVTDFIQARLGIDVQAKAVSMEQMFNMVYELALDEPDNQSEVQTAFYGMRILYNSLIARCTNFVDGSSDHGIFGLLRHLLNTLDQDPLSVVTFNYDLLVEKALTRLAPDFLDSDPLFDILTAYPVTLDHHVIGRGSSQFPESMVGGTTKIIKPHGSMNWFLAYDNAEDARRVSPPNPLGVWCCKDTVIETNFEITEQLEGGRERVLYLKPLIVPPIYEKNRFWALTLRPAWDAFREALVGADRLVVCGYSLPDADIKAQCVIAGALAANKQLKRLDVIDPNPTVCNRIVQKTCIHALNYYDSIGSFLTRSVGS